MTVGLSGTVLIFLALAGCVWVLVGVVLRERSPRWYWYLVGYPVVWARIVWTWRSLCVECALTTSRRGTQVAVGRMVVQGEALRPIVPRLWIGRPRASGLVASVRLLPGQTPEQYTAAASGMEHAWRVHAVRVDSPQRGFVRITVLIRDPLGGLVVHDPAAGPAPPASTGGAVDWERVLRLSVGVREDGLVWVLDFLLIPHWLIVGATQSGKSTLIRAIVTGLAPFPVALCGVDLKGGLEFSVVAPRLSALAITRTQAADLFERLLELAFDRMADCRAAGVQNALSLPVVPVPVVVIVDEIAEVFLATGPEERSDRDRAVTALVRLAQLGASLLVFLVVCGQRFGSELGPQVTLLRAQLGGRICHHVNDPQTAVMVFGDQFPDAVAAAQGILPSHKGFAITTDGVGGWIRARSALVTAQDAATAAHAHAALAARLTGLDLPGQSDAGAPDDDAIGGE